MFGVQAVRTKNASAIAQLKAYAQEVLAKPKATEDEAGFGAGFVPNDGR
ncbi:MAG: hypothetical protein IPK21_04075 [Haliscomenobacter sp.]|nr:hypothetical protein [Haliscomenobacter sp.]